MQNLMRHYFARVGRSFAATKRRSRKRASATDVPTPLSVQRPFTHSTNINRYLKGLSFPTHISGAFTATFAK